MLIIVEWIVGHFEKGIYIGVNYTILTIFFLCLKSFKIKFKKSHRDFPMNYRDVEQNVSSLKLIHLNKHSKASYRPRIVLGPSRNMQRVKCPSPPKQLSFSWGWGRRKRWIHKEQECKAEWEKCLKKGVNWSTGHKSHRDEILLSGVGICSVMWKLAELGWVQHRWKVKGTKMETWAWNGVQSTFPHSSWLREGEKWIIRLKVIFITVASG